MPIYEYRCKQCNKVFEEWHRHVDDDLSHPCPECRGAAERIVSNSTFVLKGGGWYVTEYGNRKGDPKQTEPSPAPAAPNAAPVPDAAPAPKPATAA
jgi:putative FmdB family regulatory protein